MWPFKRRKVEMEIVKDSIPISTLIRWYMYDLNVEDTSKMSKAFNMLPNSSEGDEKERKDSKRRLNQITGLIPFLNMFSEINAKAVFLVQREELLDSGIPESVLQQETEAIRNFYENVSFAVLVSAFSAAAQLGLIDVSGTFTDIDSSEVTK